METSRVQSDVAVLGGGPAGYVAALTAARRGARVALIERERLGGTCLNIGCIPTKALATSADLLLRARNASAFGVSIPKVAIDLPAMMAYKQSTVDELVAGVHQLMRARKVDIIQGTGRLTGPGSLLVEDGAGRRKVAADRIILAPGSVAAEAPIEGVELPGVVTSTEALDIDAIPPRLVIIGAGVIGLEFACIYEALGSQVTVIEMAPNVLVGATDEAVAKRLQLLLRRRGMTVHTSTTVQRIAQNSAALAVHAKSATGELVVDADRVLVAVGRRPNTRSMGFEDAGLRMSNGALTVDEQMATNIPGVWAIGDAVGGWMLAHKAMVEGRVAGENVTGGSRKVDHCSTPNVIFTRPEVASVGLTEADAIKQFGPVKVTQFPFSANPKARILKETDGLVRLVCEEGSGRILGMHLLGPHVTDLIAEGALAVQQGATADDLAWTTHGHPTLPEAVLEAALGFRGETIHMTTR